jgi:AcrR family transcriptional regulator
MERKPKRRTRERIVETALRLFNDFGEPNVTTTVIADEMDISPGNLYYHFHSKDEIVNALFAEYEKEIESLLTAPGSRPRGTEDIWLFLHLLFEIIWKYRFFYRDINDLLTRNRLVETHFQRILEHKQATALAVGEGLAASGILNASPGHQRDGRRNFLAVVRACPPATWGTRHRTRRLSGDVARGALHGRQGTSIAGKIVD